MCEYCSKHGAGKKWYLQARNYFKNHNDTKKRQEFVSDFISHFMDKYENYKQTGEVKRMLDRDDPNLFVRWAITRYFRNKHSGQVIPQEDAQMIMELAGQIALIPCVCRMANAGVKKNLCMLFMHIPEDRWGHRHLQGERDITPLEVDEAKDMIGEFANDGMVQTVWTFDSPHIGAVCNCDYPYCTAIRFRKDNNLIQSLLKSEYVGQIDESKCNGCKACTKMCQFGALSFSYSTHQMILNEQTCFGCGLCRNSCPRDAITLIERSELPKIKNSW